MGTKYEIWAQAAGNVVGDAVVVEEPVTCSLVVGRVQDRVVDNDLGHWSAPPLSLPPQSSNKGRRAGVAPDLCCYRAARRSGLSSPRLVSVPAMLDPAKRSNLLSKHSKERDVDVQTVDSEFQQLQQEAQETVQAIQALAGKLQTAGPVGDSDKKDWLLDLRSVALQVQQEQLQMQSLLQAIHAYAANTVQQMQQAQPTPMAFAQPAAPAQQESHGGIGRFFGGNFGHAMEQGAGMGVGFGVSNAIIGSIFGN